MIPLPEIEARIEALAGAPDAAPAVAELLGLGEAVLEHWIAWRDGVPTRQTREGFRLLALHRQGAKGDPSFNACRETCRELVFHYNIISAEAEHPENRRRLAMAAMLARHLLFFVAGKMEVEALGEFCCSSRPLRSEAS